MAFVTAALGLESGAMCAEKRSSLVGAVSLSQSIVQIAGVKPNEETKDREDHD